MPFTASRRVLRNAELVLNGYLIASENWNDRYTSDPKLFRRLVRAEARTQQGARDYLDGIAGRSHWLINWTELQRRLTAAEDVVVTVGDSAWDSESELLFKAIGDHLQEAALVGGLIAEKNMGVDVGFGIGNASLKEAIRKQTGKAIRGILDTTRAGIKSSILHGVDAGETIQEIIERVNADLGGAAEWRAELIARTEVVAAATQGQLALAADIGTQFKVWDDGQAGECEICLSISPKRVPVDDQFSDGSDGPPAHPRCRCGMSLDYASPAEAAALADGTYDPSADYGE